MIVRGVLRPPRLLNGAIFASVRQSMYVAETLVRPARFERATSCSGGKHSIQLSYGRIFYAYCRLRAFERQLMLSFGPLSNQPEQVAGGTGFLGD